MVITAVNQVFEGLEIDKKSTVIELVAGDGQVDEVGMSMHAFTLASFVLRNEVRGRKIHVFVQLIFVRVRGGRVVVEHCESTSVYKFSISLLCNNHNIDISPRQTFRYNNDKTKRGVWRMNLLLIISLILNGLTLLCIVFLLMRGNRYSQDMNQLRTDQSAQAREGRNELQTTLHLQSQTNLKTLELLANQQQKVLNDLVQQLDRMRTTVEQKLTTLQEDNSKKLEQMRSTVEEKLQSTLEQRLGESFKQVSERLEQVHKGLGEMQSLASGVGDLKKVLVNVKTRGMMGEIQLANLLEQIFAIEQYETNVAVRPGSQEKVEFALKLPAKEEAKGFIYLPIDSKFPLEDYQRLLHAQEAGDKEAEQEALKQLVASIKREARKIRDKYIVPPHTTDFAILFLPFEGLYAEVIRRPGLWDELQRECRVVISGPSTLAALLNSLQMGFRTLAIQKRSSEVWQLLGAVKAKFSTFGQLLEKAQKKIEEAGRSIESAGSSSRQIEKKLAKVQELELVDASQILSIDED